MLYSESKIPIRVKNMLIVFNSSNNSKKYKSEHTKIASFIGDVYCIISQEVLYSSYTKYGI